MSAANTSTNANQIKQFERVRYNLAKEKGSVGEEARIHEKMQHRTMGTTNKI